MSAYINYLEQEISALRREADSFRASDRKDEAALRQVQLNIDEICLTIYNVCTKLASNGGFTALYLQKLDQLPAGWAASRALAEAHGDICKVVIEDVKLQTLARNREKYLELD